MAAAVCPPPISFEALKVPLVDELLIIFKRSHEYKELQHDNKLNHVDIAKSDLWQPLLDSIMECVHDSLVTKKSSLASKKKAITKRLEEVLVIFVDSNYKSFEEEALYDLPGHMRGVIRLHASNFLRITKREMCHNISDGGKKVKSIVKYAFETSMHDISVQNDMRDSGRESLYYITGWLLRASLKAAKQRDKDVREQLNTLVSKSSYSRETALENSNIPTAKVELVERFGGLSYANEDFFHLLNI